MKKGDVCRVRLRPLRGGGAYDRGLCVVERWTCHNQYEVRLLVSGITWYLYPDELEKLDEEGH